jgi:dolichyl-phosphate-mannose-protein mannosyltransferase
MSARRIDGVRGWLSELLTKPESDGCLTTRHHRRSLGLVCAGVVLLSAAVRLLYFQDMRGEVLHEQSLATNLVYNYEEEKQRMANDGGLLFPSKPLDPGDARMLFHPPGYSILLAAIYGNDAPDRYYTALRLIQIVVAALTDLLILLIAAQLFPLAVAGIAGVIAAISPHFAYHSLWLSPDTLYILPILAAIYLFIRAYKRPRLVTVVSAGALLGLSCWLRSNTLLLAPFLVLVIALLFERGKRLTYSVALVCAMAIVISPITIRNWVVFHRFVPVTLASGLLLVEGIAEYDAEGRLGMAAYDQDVCLKDAEWHGRRDYRKNLWVPDGIDRDHSRFARAFAVLRDNLAWAVSVMLQRMAFMVRYNDFRTTAMATRTSRAPCVSWTPAFGHNAEVPSGIQPVSSITAEDWLGGAISQKAAGSFANSGQEVVISGFGAADETLLVSAPGSLKKQTDYILKISAELEEGEAAIDARSTDQRVTLGRQVLLKVPEPSTISRKEPGSERRSEVGPPPSYATPIIEIPFASGHQTATEVAISDHAKPAGKISIRLGRTELFELGPTPYQWTRPPRAVIRALQQNVFKTTYMRLLIGIGIILLVLAGQWRTLLLVLAVPAYFLLTHAPFGIDYRFTLPMHYFLFIFVAVALYCTSISVARLTKHLKRRVTSVIG